MARHISLVALFLIVVTVYYLAGPSNLTDTKFTMVLTQTLIEKGSFKIDSLWPVKEKSPDLTKLEFPRELVVINNHLYYRYPNASALLSVPYLAFLNLFGTYPVDEDMSWNGNKESLIQLGEASILSALFVCMVFVISRWLLNERYAWFISLTAAGGTQLLSIASRAMWSHTLGIFLLGVVILLLVKAETTKRLNPYLMATLLMWMWFVRPTHSLNILAVSFFIFACYREIFLRYALTVTTWLTLFMIYSMYNFNTLIPQYFIAPSDVGNPHYFQALAGNLISPSRGLFIYSPFWILVIYLLVKHKKQLRYKGLTVLAIVVSIAQYVLGSVYLSNWWGGHTYGPRILSDMLPWLILLATISIDAYRNSFATRASTATFEKRVLITLAIVFISFSFFTHWVGAFRHGAHLWNIGPLNIDKHPERVWDWRDPQFLRL